MSMIDNAFIDECQGREVLRRAIPMNLIENPSRSYLPYIRVLSYSQLLVHRCAQPVMSVLVSPHIFCSCLVAHTYCFNMQDGAMGPSAYVQGVSQPPFGGFPRRSTSPVMTLRHMDLATQVMLAPRETDLHISNLIWGCTAWP